MGRAFEYRRASKEARWDKMSKVFPKLAKAITVAAKQGIPDPEMNSKLRVAIANAKAQNMPNNNIEAAIKRASGKDAQDIKEISYEGKAPYGVLLFIECATDNPTRTIANVKLCLSKGGGTVVPNGSLEFMFSRKAVFELPKKDDIDLEEVELTLIDSGLEELSLEGDTIYIYGDYTEFGNLSEAIEAVGLEVSKSSLQRIPTQPIELNEDQMQEIEKIIDRLEDDDDVQAVYSNIE
ncbi:MAG: YebC/PmpR family DNA-binding transcriptional regulator [Arcobacteraceae bacterium]|jgi:YebC/PmpR family DNA-binding regulatory protein|nr:YebC/PmpR family DNA-binding transcriptional regulator [Arcobacteraceae bacterium]